MPNLARSGHAAEFHCRSAANRRKRRPISTVGRHGQNGLKRLIAMRFPTPARQFSRAKTQLSAVDSGIGLGPRGGGGNGCAGDRTTKYAQSDSCSHTRTICVSRYWDRCQGERCHRLRNDEAPADLLCPADIRHRNSPSTSADPAFWRLAAFPPRCPNADVGPPRRRARGEAPA